MRHMMKKALAASGVAALVMAAAIPASAAMVGTSDAAIAANVEQALGRFTHSVGVRVDNGQVYLRGYFGTPDEKAEIVDDIGDIHGVKGVYDYTEDLSGPES